MYKKGDLVEVVSLDYYSADFGIMVGMIAEFIKYDNRGNLRLHFKEGLGGNGYFYTLNKKQAIPYKPKDWILIIPPSEGFLVSGTWENFGGRCDLF